jgi:CO/xanthine dehydrogenase FAD-binding subunit
VVLVEAEDGSLVDVRIGCGSVTPRPHRMKKAEDVLRGRVPTEARVLSAAAAVSAEMLEETGVRWSTEYKDPVVAALTARALRKALGWSEDGGSERR